MDIGALLLLIPVIAIGSALGTFLGSFCTSFYFQHRRTKCVECGKKFKAVILIPSGAICQDCLQKKQEQYEREKPGIATGIIGGVGETSSALTEDMIKMYSDPRLQKALRQAFKPRSEKEDWEDEEE